MTDVHNDFTGAAGGRVLESTSATGGTALSVVNPTNTDAAVYSTDFTNPITGGTVAKLSGAATASGIAEVRYVRPAAVRGAQQWLGRYTGLPTATNVISQMRSATFQASDLRMTTTAQVAGVTGSLSGAGITPTTMAVTGVWLLVDEWIEQGTTATAPYNGKRKWRVRQVDEQPGGSFTVGPVLYEYTATDRYTGVQGTDQLTDYRVGDFTTTGSVLPPMYLAWLRADDGAVDYLSTPVMYDPATVGAAAPEGYAYDAGVWEPREVWTYDNGAWLLLSTPLNGTDPEPQPDTEPPSSVSNFRVTAMRLVGTGSTATAEVDVAFNAPTDNVGVHKVRIRVDGVYYRDLVDAAWQAGATTVSGLQPGRSYIITAITYDLGDTNTSPQPYPGVSITTPSVGMTLADTGPIVVHFDPSSLTTTPVTSYPPTTGTYPTLTQTTAARQPTLITAAAGRKYLRLSGDNLQTTTESGALNGATGFTIHALVRTAAASNTGLRQVYAQNAATGTAQRAALLLFDGKVRGAGRVLDADANLNVTGAIDTRDGQWHHIAVRGNAATKTMTTFVDGQVDTTGAWQAAQTAVVMSATNSNGSTMGGGTTGTEQLAGDLGPVVEYSRPQTDAEVAQTAALMPFPTDVVVGPPPLAATTTLTPVSPYRVDIAWPADSGDPVNQPWQVERTGAWPVRVLGPKYRSPHMSPGAKTFRYRKELTPADTTTGTAATYGPWIDAPGITVRAWPSTTATATDGHRLSRWSLPLDWGQRADVPGVRTVNITRTYDITAPGDYLLKLPTTGPLNVGRLDINVAGSVTGGAVRFAIIGGELHTDATAAIAMKLNAVGTSVPIFGFIKGVRFSGGNGGDAIQLNWPDTFDSTLVLQDIWVDPPIQGEQTGQHADVLQAYGGPATVLIDGLEGHSTYQGFMLNPGQFGLVFRTAAEGPGWYGEYGFTRVHFVGEPRASDGKASIMYYLIATGASTKPEIIYSSSGADGLFETWTTATPPPTNISNGVTLSGGVLVSASGDQKPGIWAGVQRGVTPGVGAIIDHSGPYAPGWAYTDRGSAPIPAP